MHFADGIVHPVVHFAQIGLERAQLRNQVNDGGAAVWPPVVQLSQGVDAGPQPVEVGSDGAHEAECALVVVVAARCVGHGERCGAVLWCSLD